MKLSFPIEAVSKSLTVVTSWVLQQHFCLNPCCKVLRDECLSMLSIMLLLAICSSIFEVTEVRDMGL